jgi:hypothetical protein
MLLIANPLITSTVISFWKFSVVGRARSRLYARWLELVERALKVASSGDQQQSETGGKCKKGLRQVQRWRRQVRQDSVHLCGIIVHRQHLFAAVFTVLAWIMTWRIAVSDFRYVMGMVSEIDITFSLLHLFCVTSIVWATVAFVRFLMDGEGIETATDELTRVLISPPLPPHSILTYFRFP